MTTDRCSPIVEGCSFWDLALRTRRGREKGRQGRARAEAKAGRRVQSDASWFRGSGFRALEPGHWEGASLGLGSGL